MTERFTVYIENVEYLEIGDISSKPIPMNNPLKYGKLSLDWANCLLLGVF